MNTAEQITFLRARISAIQMETFEIHVEFGFTDERDMRETLLARYHALSLEFALHNATLDSLNEAFLRARISAIEVETFEIHVEFGFTDDCNMHETLLARYHALSLEFALHCATLNSLTDGNG